MQGVVLPSSASDGAVVGLLSEPRGPHNETEHEDARESHLPQGQVHGYYSEDCGRSRRRSRVCLVLFLWLYVTANRRNAIATLSSHVSGVRCAAKCVARRVP